MKRPPWVAARGKDARLFTEIAVVIVLTFVNGLLAMSELAVVSSRPARLKAMADQGSRGARMALRLADNPGRFLSTVQIGITLVGVLSGAFSGATLGARLAGQLEELGLPNGWSEALGVGSVVVAITYLSLIVGELVPKQIALRDAERVAIRVAPAMALLSRVAAPLVWVLDASGRFVLGLLGQRGESGERVTEEEVRTLIAEAESAGVLESDERDMIAGVMRLSDRTARGLMTPRREVEQLDLSDAPDEIMALIRRTRRTRLPVQDGEADTIVGVIRVKDVVHAMLEAPAPFDPAALDLRALVQPAPIVTDHARALDVLRAIRASTVHMALVFDEYGHFEGIVTAGDVLEAITGAFAEEEGEEPAIVTRPDGSFLVSGWMPIDEFSERVGLPLDRDADYETVAGLVLHALGHLPEVGERVTIGRYVIEVVDLDGRRIDKVIVGEVG
jgi:putative hemolysin